uniref:Photosystem I reaction center subunit VI n=1 Tax=Rhizophora mucronata TaxID=61149 RepID=A0A2P2M639_RHIMU
MASLATLAAVQPAANIKGLGGSSLSGTKLHVKPSGQSMRLKNFRHQILHLILFLLTLFHITLAHDFFFGFIYHCLLYLCFGSRSGAVVAKYGDKSVYFDLEDLGNTTGQWDLYGSDAPSPYNPLQVCDYISHLIDSI